MSKSLITGLRSVKAKDIDPDLTHSWVIRFSMTSGNAYMIGNSTSYQAKHEDKMRSFEVPTGFSQANARRIVRTLKYCMENYDEVDLRLINDIIKYYIAAPSYEYPGKV